MASKSSFVDPKSGFCVKTKTFYSLRPEVPLPSETIPLSFTSYALSLLPSPLPSHPALIDASSTSLSISYPSFISHITSLSSNLHTQLNLSKGQVAFILSPPNLHIPVLYFSLLSLGVVVSPSNPASSPSEISYQLSLISPSIAFVSSSSASLLPPHIHTVILDSSHFLSLLTEPSPIPNPTPVHQSDTAAILFSSGTTGRVKGAVLSHRNLTAAVAIGSPAVAVQMITVPLFHVFGIVYALITLVRGQTAVIQTERFDEGRTARAVERFRVTSLVLAPPALLRLVRFCEGGGGDGIDFGSLERIASGGAPIGIDLIRRLMKRFPQVLFVQGYGMTESTAGVFRPLGPEESRRLGSVGRLLAGCEAKIVDPVTGIALHPCQEGELWIKGPVVIMKGYIGDDEATSANLNSGWLKTGDLCYIDNDGFLFVVDRLKELIKYKGYQVPPAELEHLLQTHSDIIEAAVIPYPDEEAGQVPMAFIVRKPNSTVQEDEIMEFVAKQVAPYKKVRRVSFVNSIPKTPAGKILRRDLIRLATSKANPKL